MDAVAPHKYVDPWFLDALEELAAKSTEPNWWRDVLKSDELFLAVRQNSLNAYYHGASIFRIEWRGGRVRPFTHPKYLVRNTQANIELMQDQTFKYPGPSIWQSYDGSQTLRDMMTTAKLYAGVEKSGLHPLLMGSPKVIDVEVSLPGAPSEKSMGKSKQDRLDAVTARKEDGHTKIVFYEAKHFSNPELRAKGDGLPEVIERQIPAYEATLNKHKASLAAGYMHVAQALARIHEMRVMVRGPNAAVAIDKTILEIANGVSPVIDTKPHLLIFGFDNAQKIDPTWKDLHLKKLKHHLPGRVHAIGNPTRKIAAFR